MVLCVNVCGVLCVDVWGVGFVCRVVVKKKRVIYVVCKYVCGVEV